MSNSGSNIQQRVENRTTCYLDPAFYLEYHAVSRLHLILVSPPPLQNCCICIPGCACVVRFVDLHAAPSKKTTSSKGLSLHLAVFSFPVGLGV